MRNGFGASVLLAILLCFSFHSSWGMVGTPGQAGVSDGGEASYSVPLRVPPGTGGMEPKLSLGYSSRGGNGAFGQGWGLSGLSSITRCPLTRAQDGTAYNGAIRYDANDRLCLDGQRLIAVVGAYGEHGTQYRKEIDDFTRIVGLGRFAYQTDAWFEVRSRDGVIRTYGNSEDSRITAQGKNATAVWALKSSTDRNGNTLTWSWGQDPGNGYWWPAAVDYTGHTSGTPPYARVVFEAAGRPDQIPRFQAGAKVQTSIRITKISTYLEGSLVREYRLDYDQSPISAVSRLTQITECSPSDGCLLPTRLTWGAVGSPPGYSFATPLNGAPVTTNTGLQDRGWGGRDETANHYLIMDVNGDGRTDMVVTDPEGRDIQVWLFNSASNQFSLTSVTPLPENIRDATNRFLAMDVNGDGLSDMVIRKGDRESALITYLSNGSGFYEAGRVTYGMFRDDVNKRDYGCPQCDNPLQYSNLEINRFFVMDVNGDGRSDIVHRDKWGVLNTWLSNGSTFYFVSKTGSVNGDMPFRDNLGRFTASGCDLDDSFWPKPGRVFITDINGDGMSDLIALNWGWDEDGKNSGNFGIFLSNGTGFDYSGATPFSIFGGHILLQNEGTYEWRTAPPWSLCGNQDSQVVLADVNGDGRADMVHWGGEWGVITTWLSTGTNFVAAGQTSRQDDSLFSSLTNKAFPMDVNGDGRTDLVLRDSRGILQTWISNGITFDKRGEDLTGQGDNADANGNWSSTSYSAPSRYFVMDLDGLGRASLVTRSPEGNLTAMRLNGTPHAADLLTQIDDGLGARFNFAYQSISQQGSVYAKDGAALPYPLMRVQSPLYVASRFETTVPGSVTHPVETFSYYGLRAEVGTGRGSLGFSGISRRQEVQQRNTSLSFRQDFPYAGRLASKRTEAYSSTGGGWVETEAIINTYDCRTLSYGQQPAVAGGDCGLAPGRSYFIYQTQSTKSGVDLNGAQMPSATTTNTYDCQQSPGAVCYGNLKQSLVTTPDGHRKTLNFDYRNDLALWAFGLPTRMSTDGLAPDWSGLARAPNPPPEITPTPPAAQPTTVCTANIMQCLQPILTLLLDD